MRFFEYLFFKYYNWAIKVGDGDIPSTTSVMCISLGITLYCIDIAMAYSFFIAPQSIVSNIYKYLFPLVFPIAFMLLYCTLVIKGKDKQIMEKYKEVWLGKKHLGAVLLCYAYDLQRIFMEEQVDNKTHTKDPYAYANIFSQRSMISLARRKPSSQTALRELPS